MMMMKNTCFFILNLLKCHYNSSSMYMKLNMPAYFVIVVFLVLVNQPFMPVICESVCDDMFLLYMM